jgi:hypothetical protein
LLLCALKDVRDRLRIPLPAARRCDASGVQRFRNLPEGTRACLLCFADDWQHVTGIRSENSVKTEFYKLRDEGHLERVLAGNKSAWRLTAKGKAFLQEQRVRSACS